MAVIRIKRSNIVGNVPDVLDDGELAINHADGLLFWRGADGQVKSTPLELAINVIPGLQAALDGKAAVSHVHAIGDVTGLQAALDGKAARPSKYVNHVYHPDECLIYQDIFAARDAGAIAKLGNPAGYNDTSYTAANPWNGSPIIAYGGNNEADGNGALITVPDGYDLVWVRVLGNRWNVVSVRDHVNPAAWEQRFAGGYRNLNPWSPDGGAKDGYWNYHEWMPIPTRGASQLQIVSKPNTNYWFWVSGLTFSTNPWAHVYNSAIAYHWAVNGGDAAAWSTHNWNNDQLAYLPNGSALAIKVPVIKTGRDKLIYAVTHGNNLATEHHAGVSVNGTAIERLRGSYSNPIQRHVDGAIYSRYMAARVPDALIPAGAQFLNVVIDMSTTNNHFYFREIGTHDLEAPQ